MCVPAISRVKIPLKLVCLEAIKNTRENCQHVRRRLDAKCRPRSPMWPTIVAGTELAWSSTSIAISPSALAIILSANPIQTVPVGETWRRSRRSKGEGRVRNREEFRRWPPLPSSLLGRRRTGVAHVRSDTTAGSAGRSPENAYAPAPRELPPTRRARLPVDSYGNRTSYRTARFSSRSYEPASVPPTGTRRSSQRYPRDRATCTTTEPPPVFPVCSETLA